MLQLKGTDNEGNPCYFMGLTGVETSKIVFESLPLVVDLVGLNGAEAVKIIIIYGRTEQEIIEHLSGAGITVSLPVDEVQS